MYSKTDLLNYSIKKQFIQFAMQIMQILRKTYHAFTFSYFYFFHTLSYEDTQGNLQHLQ